MVHGSVSNVAGRECSVWGPYFCANFTRPPPLPLHYPSFVLSLFDGEASPRELPKTCPWKPQNRVHATVSAIRTH